MICSLDYVNHVLFQDQVVTSTVYSRQSICKFLTFDTQKLAP